MGKKISTYYREDGRGYAEIHLDMKDESFYVKYFYDDGRLIEVKEYPNQGITTIENVVEDWALSTLDVDFVK